MIATVAVLVLGGCGADTFDPANARPCDFFTTEERDKYALAVKLNEPDRCEFGKKRGFSDSLTHVTVEYRDDDAATVAATLGVARVEDEDSAVGFKGSVETEFRRGNCLLVTPIAEGGALVVTIGTDTTSVTWNKPPRIDDPCEYVALEFEEIEAKLPRG